MQTQQFDGPSLAALLSRVQALYGQQVKIIAARKARKGGVGGFFSREWFEVVVEVPEDTETDESGSIASSIPEVAMQPHDVTQSILELAEELNSEQASVVNITAHDFASAAQASLAQAQSVASAPIFTPQPQTVASSPAPPQTSMPVQNGFVVPQPTQVPMPNDQQESFTTAPSIDITAPAQEFATVLNQVQVEEKPMAPVEMSSFVRVGPIANGIEMPQVVDAPPTKRKVRPEVELANALIRRGIPRAMLPEFKVDESYAEQLERVFKQCPVLSESDLNRSRVIAVVGIDDEANTAANFLAERLEVPSTQLAIASRQKSGRIDVDEIATTDDAIVMKRSWRRRNTPTVLAFSVKRNRSNLTWCREILASLEPDMTIVVADAREKPEDIEASVNAIAGVEAIIVENAAATSSPAAVLRLGIPIVYLDQKVATPRVWSSLLLEGIDNA